MSTEANGGSHMTVENRARRAAPRCSQCRGRGTIFRDQPCPKCNGAGYENLREIADAIAGFAADGVWDQIAFLRRLSAAISRRVTQLKKRLK